MERENLSPESKEQTIKPHILAAIVQIQINELLRRIARQGFVDNMNA